eukprot:15452851-Alexandrium_andersonii.AAC.1
MSASLVGSEMCIRDSTASNAWTHADTAIVAPLHACRCVARAALVDTADGHAGAIAIWLRHCQICVAPYRAARRSASS